MSIASFVNVLLKDKTDKGSKDRKAFLADPVTLCGNHSITGKEMALLYSMDKIAIRDHLLYVDKDPAAALLLLEYFQYDGMTREDFAGPGNWKKNYFKDNSACADESDPSDALMMSAGGWSWPNSKIDKLFPDKCAPGAVLPDLVIVGEGLMDGAKITFEGVREPIILPLDVLEYKVCNFRRIYLRVEGFTAPATRGRYNIRVKNHVDVMASVQKTFIVS